VLLQPFRQVQPWSSVSDATERCWSGRTPSRSWSALDPDGLGTALAAYGCALTVS